MRLLPIALLGCFGLAQFLGRAPAADPEVIQADEKTLRNSQIGTDGPALLTFFRQRTPEPGEVARAAALIREMGDETFQVREQATRDLIKLGKGALPHLKKALQDPDVEIARRAEHCLEQIELKPTAGLSISVARLVADRKPADAAAVLLDYLPFAEDDTVADEIRTALGTVAVRNQQPEKVLVDALADPTAIRRGAAAEALIRGQAPEPARTAARRLLQDPDPGARLNIALALFAVRDNAGVEPLIDLVAALPESDVWRAEEALFQLAGEKAPQLPATRTPAARQKSREAWAAWYRDHGSKIDLAKVNPDELMAGLTLLVQMDVRGITGRVMEIGRDGKPRWQIEGLGYPLDAQWLPGGRILVAEYRIGQVTERDLKGEVLWRQQAPNPLGCQRLVNGNTFITCRNQLLEVDRNGKTIFSFPRPNYDIMAARKFRNGETAFVTNAGQCVRLDNTGKQVKAFQAVPIQTFANIDVLATGRILVPDTNGGRVLEYDLDGNIKWQAKVVYPTSVVRLPNGHTLVASMNNQVVQELDQKGNSVWQHKPDGRPWRARQR